MSSNTRDIIVQADEYEDSSAEEDSASPEPEPVPKPSLNLGLDNWEANSTADGADGPSQATTASEDVDDIETQKTIHARAYQIEMFEKSLEQNIIVAMDTGSGKTQVAVLRIQAELEKSPEKIIWFLAPTVPLCEQQFRVIKPQIGTAQIKILSGADGIDTWSDARIWNDYLHNVRVVVSTYQILLDAITHGFIQIDRLSLIIFDEAHNCVGKHPGSKIMERYRIQKNNGMPYPAILGLTASPIMKSNLSGIDKIEQTLDAVCRAPTIHREEFLLAAKRPTLIPVAVLGPTDYPTTDSMNSLLTVYHSLDIYQDPYVLRLLKEKTEKNIDRLRKALTKRETYVMAQMQSFYRKSVEINRQLGPSASDYFIHKGVTQFLGSVDTDLTWFETWDVEEKQYLANALRRVNIKPPRPFQHNIMMDVSSKFNTLVKELQRAPDDTRCIVFVLETATVAVLAHMLSTTALVSDRFRVGTMVGSSSYASRKRDLGELNRMTGSHGIEDFRTGKLNLLIATSVAEEGIDVPACNLVICFDPPYNVKSFIQRRGRARMENSKIVLLLGDSPDQHDAWMELEDMMKKHYADESRAAGELQELEDLDGDIDIPPLCVPSTGAQLDFDQAKSHLEHFCQKITSGKYVDHGPYYIAEEVEDIFDGSLKIIGTVHLPPSLPPTVRRVKGIKQWHSEKNAFKDAAFQAFKALYEAGLVNAHLMPLMDDILEGVETRSSMMEVNDFWKPWPTIAQLWETSDEVVQRTLCLRDGHRIIATFKASLPCRFPPMSPIQLYWNLANTWTLETSEGSDYVPASSLKRDQSAALLHLAYGHRWPVEDIPSILHLESSEEIVFRQHTGRQPVGESVLDPDFVIRNANGTPYVFVTRLPCKPSIEQVKRIEKEAQDEPDDIPWLALEPWPRRLDFLHPVIDVSPEPDGRFSRALPASWCTMDTVNRSKVHFGSIIPSIVHVLETYFIVEELCRTVLAEVGFSNASLVLTAISSSAARETTNYERLEFLGDSVLKILATISVMVQYPHFPEGYLSAMKDRIVSNSRLCRASVERGLDKFILTTPFVGKKWRPPYREGFLSNQDKEKPKVPRVISTKTLADVVESLVGAAFIDGGIQKALICLQIFLPEVKWHNPIDAQRILYSRKETITSHGVQVQHKALEELVGYTFQNKALLMECLTHASWSMATANDACMERLEFLGDSVLDSVIVSAIWAHDRGEQLTNHQMHLLRVACVNADFLGFLIIEWCSSQEATEVIITKTPAPTDPDLATVVVNHEPVPFWKYMRHRSAHVASVQQLAEQRHAAEREAILDAMASGPHYPWAPLAHLGIPKFFSDMFESLIGAVWVDSGSMAACERVVERVGILPYLRRLLRGEVIIQHPKNRLGELAGHLKVRYETGVRAVDAVTKEKDLFCKVFVDEKFILEVNAGINPEEIITRAADEACRVLLSQTNGTDMEDVAMAM